MTTKQQQVCDAILQTLVENPNLRLKLIVKIVGCFKSTVIRTLKKYLTFDTINRKLGSGNNLNINKKLKTNVLANIRANSNISEQDLFLKCKTTRQKVQTIKKKLKFKSFKIV